MSDLSKEHRAQAEAVADGHPKEDAWHVKAVAYGELGRLLSADTLQEIVVPPCSGDFIKFEEVLKSSMYAHVQNAFWSRQMGGRSRLDQAVRANNRSRGIGSTLFPALDRLMAGVNTASEIETITLRTIAKRLDAGEHISRAGLYASKRVPFAYALVHMKDLNFFDDDCVGWTDSRGYQGQILRDDLVRLSPEHGLSLTRQPQQLDRESSLATEYGPQIGCPITLMKGALETVHRIASDTALATGLIQATD